MAAAVSPAQHVYCRDLLHEYSTSGFVLDLFKACVYMRVSGVQRVHNCGYRIRKNSSCP